MAIKKNHHKNSQVFFLLLAAAAVLGAVFLIAVVLRLNRPGAQPNKGRAAAEDLLINQEARIFEILAVSPGHYQGRDANSQQVENILVPERLAAELLKKGGIKVGDWLVVKNYIVAANGLVAQELRILPPPPEALPTSPLPDKPNE